MKILPIGGKFGLVVFGVDVQLWDAILYVIVASYRSLHVPRQLALFVQYSTVISLFGDVFTSMVRPRTNVR